MQYGDDHHLFFIKFFVVNCVKCAVVYIRFCFHATHIPFSNTDGTNFDKQNEIGFDIKSL